MRNSIAILVLSVSASVFAAGDHVLGNISDLRWEQGAGNNMLAVWGSPDVLDGLVGWWKMDEASWVDSATGVVDSAGTNPGVSFGGATTAAGKIDRGGIFNGATSYVSLPASELSAFTWSVWVKADNNIGWKLVLNRDGTPPSFTRVCRMDQSGASYSFIVFTTGGIIFPEALSFADTSLWHHIVITVDDAFACVYADGVLASQTAMPGTVITSPNEIWLAASTTVSGQNFFPGMLDDFRVYNRALTSNEVSTIYNRAN